MREIAVFLHSWHKFYTTAGRDGRDKSQLCTVGDLIYHYCNAPFVLLEAI